jgi:hypothetical protein
MQEALQAAVTRMNNGNGSSEPKIGPMDTMGALMTIVPKLLQGSESSGEMVERLDALQKGDLTSLRGQVQILRKQCYRMLKSQEQLLEKVHEIQKEQTTVARAVLDLAHHMSRITFIEDPPADDFDYAYEREPPPAPDSYRRAESRTNGNGRGTRPRHTSDEHGPTSRAGRSK